MTDQHQTPQEPSRAAGSNQPLVIAIDGPSGSGKSSTARGVAERLGLAFLDTGAMYRAITWLALQEGVDLDDPSQVRRLRPGGPAVDLGEGRLADGQHPDLALNTGEKRKGRVTSR